MLDKIGQPITIGCYIAYGHALGRCAGLRIGKVLKIEEREEEWHGRTTPAHTIYRITVLGIDDDWNFKKPELLSKKSTLQFPERVVVLSDGQVPYSYKNLFNDASF